MHRRLSICAVLGVAVVLIGLLHAEAGAPTISAIVTTADQRSWYLAHATIWRQPRPLSPDDVLDGPRGVFPYTFTHATSVDGVTCAFTTPGKELSGRSEKFECRSEDGHILRIKYWDAENGSGNREVFASVVATRLLWALGFNAVPVLPIKVRCQGCPANPMTGQGETRDRRYIGLMEIRLPMPVIVSGENLEQGWSWHELDDAIASLPPGDERLRQRTYFDALTLLAVLIQHGDRKPEQQALDCEEPVDSTRGEVLVGDGSARTLLLEHSGLPACPRSAVTMVDVGATFGGAGRLSRESTAKMNFEAWRRKPVFVDGTCRGRLTVSMAAGRNGEPDPLISEEGRRFLVEQLRRLGPEQVRALFEAGQIEWFSGGRRPNTSHNVSSVDAWVSVFEDKVRQIEARTCPPAWR